MSVGVQKRIVLLLALVAKLIFGFGSFKQEWDFEEIRPGAHLFWWLHYCIAENITDPSDRPLIVWLQGGPGWSSTAFGNFEEIGPFDRNSNFRNTTWIKHVNVLFVDSPVGTGFSYVENSSQFAKDNNQIARDLVQLMKNFMEKFPKFKKNQIYVFSESYGGKMAVEFAWELHNEFKSGNISWNINAIGLGNPFISPRDTIESYGAFLYQMGMIDIDKLDKFNEISNEFGKRFDNNDYFEAFKLMVDIEDTIKNEVLMPDFYNILATEEFKTPILDTKLINFMSENVSKVLDIPEHVIFNEQSFKVQHPLFDSFVKPVTELVELILNTDIKIIVYSGQLDVICATPGTVKWVNTLKWPYSEKYKQSPRCGLFLNDILQGYRRRYRNLEMIWVMRSGHMVAIDNPEFMEFILLDAIGSTNESAWNEKCVN